jgi:ABC-type sulfate/molybdate transport systems ATPase subunit
MTAVLALHDYTVRVAGQILIERLDVEVGPGEVLGVFGDSGSGKSSLLHLIAGLSNRPFTGEGDLLLHGEEIGALDPARRSLKGISIVLQDLGLFANRDVSENVAYPLFRRRWPADRVRERVHESLARLGLEGLEGRHPGELSGGQRQRVAFARALSYGPSLLLLDEPLRGLQDELRYDLLAMLRALCSEGMAIVLVTHDREEVALIADRIVCLGWPGLKIEHRGADGFEALRRLAPAPAPERTLAASDLSSNDPAGVPLQILDVRVLPSGGRCALATINGGNRQFLQLAEGSAIAPGSYRITEKQLQRLVSKEK